MVTINAVKRKALYIYTAFVAEHHLLKQSFAWTLETCCVQVATNQPELWCHIYLWGKPS